MKTSILITILAVFTIFHSVDAHPLGNFTVNQFTRIEVETDSLRVHQVLDLAEIPTFQESSLIDADKDGTMTAAELDVYLKKITPGYIANLGLVLNDEALDPVLKKANAELVAGNGNLQTLRITWDLEASVTAQDTNRVRFENKNYAERLGWNEIVVNRSGAINIYDSGAYGSGVTDELRSYPEENLAAPLMERKAEFSFTTGEVPANAQALRNRDGHIAPVIQKDRLAELISVPEITLPIALLGLLLAFGLGAMHAMSPGHGKTVVGAYLVGSRGTAKHAIFLGLTVTVTHTLGVFALGFITLFASQYILPERIMPFLNFVSGLLVFFIGISLFKDRLFGALGWKTASLGHSHGSADGHTHEPGQGEHSHDGLTHTHGGSTHSHALPEDISWKSLLALGISGGLLPCPSALVLMLSAISLGRVGYGIILTLVFSFGLAATLTVVGLMFLYVGKIFSNSRLSENRLIKAVPVLSALVVACLGAVICYNSLG